MDKENERIGLQEIIDKAIEEMAREAGDSFELDHLNLANKFDKEMALTNNLFVNLDELDAIRPSQQSSLKQTLSVSKVNGRPIFGRTQEDRPRFASFVATTNNRHPLQDVTGSRRYICILIPDAAAALDISSTCALSAENQTHDFPLKPGLGSHPISPVSPLGNLRSFS